MPKDDNHIEVDFNNENSNTSSNPTFDDILATRLSRRQMLKGTGGALGAVAVAGGTLPLAACTGGPLLAFNPVAKSLADAVIVPEGYETTILYALGDPLSASTPAYKNDGSDNNFEDRAGDHHDGMEFFGLTPNGRPSTSSNNRAVLGMNHEATTDEKLSSFFIHATGGVSTLPRPAVEVDKEMAIHGLSFVEVKKTGKTWATVNNSAFNRRVHQQTEVEIAGPARGNKLLVTKFSTAGVKTRGTLNNCGTGKTPWGTFLTGEENWAGYFTRNSTDDAARGNDKSVTSLKRYGRAQGAASRHGWETGGVDDKYARWNISKLGISLDGSDDYRNELNGMGYIVEVDAYRKHTPIKKRSALGRFAHESAAFGTPVVGQPLAVYMGDDSRNEYIYKFVSTAKWSAADAKPIDGIATGDKYLDSGTLFVAKFNADGTGEWVALNLDNPTVAGYSAYKFDDLADICVNTRLAADAVGATKMDRPEWCSTNPANGEIYFTLTNNSNRSTEAGKLAPDAANPRAYVDTKGSSTLRGNVNGHILRVKESNGNAGTTFTWDVYVFGAQADSDATNVNLSGLTADNDFSSPDGLAFVGSTGLMWIQTDDGAYTDVTNCMLLAAIPGKVGDGGKKTVVNSTAAGTSVTVDTLVGAAPGIKLKRFLVGPKDCEITGICETPDGKSLFINIQHPGEGTAMANVTDPSKYTSQWPSNAGYGAGNRPRSATIVITKTNGDRVGT